VGPEPRTELLNLHASEHGGAAAGVLDFSTGISPLQPPPAIVEAAKTADLSRYPHPTALPYRVAAAALHDLLAEQVVAGAGSVELIWALARAFGGAGRAGLVVTPAFGEYAQALCASGADVVTVEMREPSLELSLADLDQALTTQPISIAFVCRPSNPCLTAARQNDLTDVARRWPNTLFVVDEAYQPMFDDVSAFAPTANVAVLRSMTKVFALPGLRLGYMLASHMIAAATQAALPPWNVSSAAQAAGIVAAQLLPSESRSIRERITSLRSSLEDKLAPVAGPPARSGGPFTLYRVGGARNYARRLSKHGVAVRDCTSFGLPDYVRLGTRNEADQNVLATAWLRASAAAEGDTSAP
jgi:histidinol-phosphate aminotransferase